MKAFNFFNKDPRSTSSIIRGIFAATLVFGVVFSFSAPLVRQVFAEQEENQHQDNNDNDKKDNKKSDDENHDDEDDNDKVNICHKTSSESNPWEALNVDNSSVSTHLGHGDFLYNGPTKDNGKPDNKDKKAEKWCKDNVPTPPVVTGIISAQKIVCDSESDLPNWGSGDIMPSITSTTAADYVAAHSPQCKIVPWTFEWAPSSAANPGDNTVGATGGVWTAFTSTVQAPAGQQVWVREQMQNGYIPFSGIVSPDDLTTNTAKNSAEFYCDGDVLNYDNYEMTGGVDAQQPIYCVGFNVKVPEPLQCNPEQNLLQNGDFELPVVSNGGYSIVKDIVEDPSSVLKWLVAWAVPTPGSGILGLEIQNNVAGSPEAVFGGNQFAELDGDHPVSIWQNVPTIPGKEYSFTFKYSPRPGRDAADNSIQVKKDGSVLGASVSVDGTTNSNTVWQTITRTFTATGPLTKVELFDNGTDTSFGGYVDSTSLTCKGDPAPQCNNEATQTIVSDTSTKIGELNAVELTTIHPAWTASISGAKWIWATDPVESPTNDADLVKVFTKTFNIVGTPTGGTLQIAADNNYSVKVNGISVPVVFDQDNFQSSTQDSYDVSSMLVSGLNTIEITVTNLEIGQDGSPTNNPAGLLYKLSINNNECVVPPPPVDMCKNISGNQSSVPQGYHLVGDDLCVINTVESPLPVCADGTDNDEDGLIDRADPACHTDGNVHNENSYDGNIDSEKNGENVMQCSDGIDNDGDEIADYPHDKGCSSYSDNNETNDPEPQGPTGSVGGNGAPLLVSAPATGQVLGATTSCGIYLEDFLKKGWKNNKEQVKKLQTFLNDYLNLSPKLPVNGVFGNQTYKAVIKFQEGETDLVLKPWVGVTLKDAKKGTGFVYKTTITRINNIMCPELNLPLPAAVLD